MRNPIRRKSQALPALNWVDAVRKTAQKRLRKYQMDVILKRVLLASALRGLLL